LMDVDGGSSKTIDFKTKNCHPRLGWFGGTAHVRKPPYMLSIVKCEWDRYQQG
jgi:hypothetical protein